MNLTMISRMYAPLLVSGPSLSKFCNVKTIPVLASMSNTPWAPLVMEYETGLLIPRSPSTALTIHTKKTSKLMLGTK